MRRGSGEAGLGVGAVDERVAEGFDFGGDGFEEERAVGAGAGAVGGEGGGGGFEGGGDFGGGGFVEGGLHDRAVGGVVRVEGGAAGLAGFAGDEAEAVEGHGRRVEGKS
jgi:hypothetical protein